MEHGAHLLARFAREAFRGERPQVGALQMQETFGRGESHAVVAVLGDTKDFRFLEEEKKGFFSRLFGS